MVGNSSRLPSVFTTRSLLLQRSRLSTGSKRPPSPDVTFEKISSKRAKPMTESHMDRQSLKLKERQEKEAEFKEKYTRHMKEWTFYFDTESIAASPRMCKANADRIKALGGYIEDFFSKKITHLISNRRDAPLKGTNKENIAKETHEAPLSKAKSRMDGVLSNDILVNAVNWELKIWSFEKLTSVLDRCLPLQQPRQLTQRALTENSQNIARLLRSEEEKKGFSYFPKGSCFVLVEDINEHLAPISAHSYDPSKATWPILHCHPNSRGPFVAYDEKESKRWEKTQAGCADGEAERTKQIRRQFRQLLNNRPKTGDLRRSVSMCNLRCATNDHVDDVDLEDEPYLDAAYIAASGNSVGLTSTTGTTSTAGYPIQMSSRGIRGQREFLTFRKAAAFTNNKENYDFAPMAPPPIPPTLRKYHSTNSLRGEKTTKLPKRNEGSKPGYCESCRQRFEDFKSHTAGRRHQKFATNDANFATLDSVLDRVRRRTLQELEDEELKRQAAREEHDDEGYSPEYMEVDGKY